MALVAETGAQQVHWNRLYDPESRARDEGVKAALRAAGITATSRFTPMALSVASCSRTLALVAPTQEKCEAAAAPSARISPRVCT